MTNKKTFIVLDLEWNQVKEKNTNKFYPFEIIEIGAVKLDENLNFISSFNKLVKPQLYKEFNTIINKLLNISFEELNSKGIPFSSVLKEFSTWAFKENEEVFFCTWGDRDLFELQKSIDFFKLKNPFSFPLFYYDIQKLYKLNFKDLSSTNNKSTLSDVCEKLNIKKDKPFHSALSDAFYTVEILKKIDFENLKPYFSVDYYKTPKEKEEEIYLEFPTYSKYISRPFLKKTDIFEDRDIKTIFCFKCKSFIRKKFFWFSTNQKNFVSLAFCNKHGFIKSKIRIKNKLGKYYIIKTNKFIPKLTASEIFSRKKEFNNKKKLKKQ